METLRWTGGDVGGRLVLIDQTRLPTELVEIELQDIEGVWEAIQALRVRGAPAIGIAAAYGTVIGMQSADPGDEGSWFSRLDEVIEYLASSRRSPIGSKDRLQRRTLWGPYSRRPGQFTRKIVKCAVPLGGMAQI
jgi:methylthioribose-1-phosphate isomerase